MMATREFRREQRSVARAMLGALVTSLIVLAIAATVDRTAAPMPFAARVQTAIRIDLVVIVWLAAAIANVARLRFFSARDIAGSSVKGESDTIRVAGAILQNTVEQAVLAISAHLIVAATFDRPIMLVKALAGLFAIGRLLFWAGYRRGAAGRAFGFALTFYPTMIALVACATAILLGWA